MRNICLTVYQNTLRLQGLIVMSFAILLLVGATRTDLPGFWHPFPVAASLISILIAAIFVWPRLTPKVISHPAGAVSVIVTVALHAVAPFVFMVPVMMSVLAFEVAEPMSRYIATSATGVVFLCSVALWWMGLILSLWAGPPTCQDDTPFPRDGFDFRGAA